MGKGKSSKFQEYEDTIDQLIQQGLEKRENAANQTKATQIKIVEAQRLGLNTNRANELLHKAQSILSDAQEIKEYDDAIKLALNAKNIIATLKNQQAKATQALVSAKKMVAEIEKIGITAHQPKKLIQDADIAFKSGQYANANDLATRSFQMANISKHRHSKASKLIKDAIAQMPMT